jgi:hypothetical protein
MECVKHCETFDQSKLWTVLGHVDSLPLPGKRTEVKCVLLPIATGTTAKWANTELTHSRGNIFCCRNDSKEISHAQN